MGRNTSVSLGNHFDDFVEDKISEGRYKNVSKIIRAGLRLLEEGENKIKAIKNAITEGLDSGIAGGFDAQKHLQTLKEAK